MSEPGASAGEGSAEGKAFAMALMLNRALLALNGAGLILLPALAAVRPISRAAVAPAFAGFTTGLILAALTGWLLHLSWASKSANRPAPRALDVAPHPLAFAALVAFLVGAGFALNALVRETPWPS
ncbi:hypothetical protein [Acuticoccus sp.]|uniref:hypothetical protein n=1 Tax=Acuticoccus sp. TaxID=1904378 RepID=UPI003B52707B